MHSTTFEYWPSIVQNILHLSPIIPFSAQCIAPECPSEPLQSCARQAIESQSCKLFGFGHSIVRTSVVQCTARMAWERFGRKNCKIAVSIQLPLTFCFELVRHLLIFFSLSAGFVGKYCEQGFDYLLKMFIVQNGNLRMIPTFQKLKQ